MNAHRINYWENLPQLRFAAAMVRTHSADERFSGLKNSTVNIEK